MNPLPNHIRLSLPTSLTDASSMTQHRLPLHERHDPRLFKLSIKHSQPPHLRLQHVTWSHRRGEAGRKLPQIRGVAAADGLQDRECSAVVNEEPVHDRAAEAEGFFRLLRDVQAVAVAVETVIRVCYQDLSGRYIGSK